MPPIGPAGHAVAQVVVAFDEVNFGRPDVGALFLPRAVAVDVPNHTAVFPRREILRAPEFDAVVAVPDIVAGRAGQIIKTVAAATDDRVAQMEFEERLDGREQTELDYSVGGGLFRIPIELPAGLRARAFVTHALATVAPAAEAGTADRFAGSAETGINLGRRRERRRCAIRLRRAFRRRRGGGGFVRIENVGLRTRRLRHRGGGERCDQEKSSKLHFNFSPVILSANAKSHGLIGGTGIFTVSSFSS